MATKVATTTMRRQPSMRKTSTPPKKNSRPTTPIKRPAITSTTSSKSSTTKSTPTTNTANNTTYTWTIAKYLDHKIVLQHFFPHHTDEEFGELREKYTPKTRADLIYCDEPPHKWVVHDWLCNLPEQELFNVINTPDIGFEIYFNRLKALNMIKSIFSGTGADHDIAEVEAAADKQVKAKFDQFKPPEKQQRLEELFFRNVKRNKTKGVSVKEDIRIISIVKKSG
ncbi:584_t:CDS:2, partial [Ambispora gerdemannii]